MTCKSDRSPSADDVCTDQTPSDSILPEPIPPALTSETRQTQWRRANLGKYSSHLAVQRALTSGRLHKQACEVCGAETVDAHHDRYDQPLTVRCLCRSHHVKLHH
ncbi:hypothetical protein PANO111632_19870 [Paracoccus nototheniae]|uniref:HNH endonuclease n=1 Tax=Paracoccus nototheniae TaxID=2489002 RepID=A0ABW4DVB1_9RHOB|nr:hypothetical protein [Paracoccus nototheniae]